MKKMLSVVALISAVAISAAGLTACSEESDEALAKVDELMDRYREFKEQKEEEKLEEQGYSTDDGLEDPEALDEGLEDQETLSYDEIEDQEDGPEIREDGILTSGDDINLRDVDGNDTDYEFDYNGRTFQVLYYPDHWKIFDSYLIGSAADMQIICQALIDVHPIHGSDMVSYRTASDMVYEWMQHNIAYEFLEGNDELASHAKDVDLDPQDQNKSIEEIYKDRTGKDFNISDYLN